MKVALLNSFADVALLSFVLAGIYYTNLLLEFIIQGDWHGGSSSIGEFIVMGITIHHLGLRLQWEEAEWEPFPQCP